MSSDAETWMVIALEEARAAAAAGEVPVGAVVLRDGVVLGKGRNTTEDADDPSGHAEINALREAGQVDGDWRLESTTLVVTLEPCTMCLGAIALARVERLIYGASDPRLGACGSILDLTRVGIAHHLEEVQGGVLEAECSNLLRDFFRALR
jgi:tRNA(adenine34) deaminase